MVSALRTSGGNACRSVSSDDTSSPVTTTFTPATGPIGPMEPSSEM